MLRKLVPTSHEPKVAFARELRQRETSGEKVLWKKLRARRLHGFKFRRQVPVGPFIVDFLCVEKMLVIEIDGSSHHEPGAKERDEYREDYLLKKGFHILRFGNRQTIDELPGVLDRIGRVLGCYAD